MKMFAALGTVVCLAGASSSALAQDEAARKAAVETAARVPLERAFKGAPYAAETLIEGVQQLADGNRIVRKSTGRVYRDTEGRTRREEDRKDGSAAISITDPVGGFSYSLDTTNKIAWRTPMGASGAIMGKLEAAQTEMRRAYSDEEKQKVEAAARAARSAGASDAQSKAAAVEQERVIAARAPGSGALVPTRSGGVEAPLEHKVVDGIPVEGHSTKTVIPAGQVGNEQPITILDEQWRSADLNVLVMTRHVDPRTGESSYRLLNIVRGEPDPSLFMVPADYTVKDTGIRKMLEAARK